MNKIPWHYFQGIFVIIAGIVHPVYAVLWFTGWFIYQLDECWHIKDCAYKDIPEFMYGFTTGIVVFLAYIIWRLLV